jgi:hypothetical protein
MSQVSISEETAQVALDELEKVIEQTGGDGSEEASTPLALALDRVKTSDDLNDEAKATVIKIIEEVGKERSVPTGWYDPLTDSVFDARTELEEELRPFEEGDVFMSPDGPIRLLAIKDDETVKVTDPTVGHPQDSRSGVWYPDITEIEDGILEGDLQPATLEVQLKE